MNDTKLSEQIVVQQTENIVLQGLQYKNWYDISLSDQKGNKIDFDIKTAHHHKEEILSSNLCGWEDVRVIRRIIIEYEVKL